MNRAATRSLPKQFRFEQPKSPPVVVNFQGGQVTSDAGLSLIAEIDRKLEITSQFAQCFQDYRKPYRIDHSIENLIKQRIYGLVMGYEDLTRISHKLRKNRSIKLIKCIDSKHFSSFNR